MSSDGSLFRLNLQEKKFLLLIYDPVVDVPDGDNGEWLWSQVVALFIT